MARFHHLAVTDVRKTIKDAVVVSLKPVNGGDFAFTQGQYLTFRRDFDGTEVRRSYSICAGKDDGILQVGIKKVDGGAFSTWANEELKPGDTLQAMEPMGSFFTPLDAAQQRNYLGFAGGSGITPVLSILKTTLRAEPSSTFTLVYANRGVNSIMFREELEDLKNLYMGRLTIIHVLESDAQDIDLFTGRVDAEKCEALFAHWVDIDSIDTAFICGPEPMMLGIASSLRAHGLDDAQIKFELFASAQPGRLTRRAASRRRGRRRPRPRKPASRWTAPPAALPWTRIRPSWKRRWKTPSTRPLPARPGSARPAAARCSKAKSKWSPTTRWKTTRFSRAMCCPASPSR